MFQAHIAMSVGFMALVAGTAFLLWLKKQQIIDDFARYVAYATIAFSLIGLLCTAAYSLCYWWNGYFKAPNVITYEQQNMQPANPAAANNEVKKKRRAEKQKK